MKGPSNHRLNCTVCENPIRLGERREPAYGGTAHSDCVVNVIERADQRLHENLADERWLTDANDAEIGFTVVTYQGDKYPITDIGWTGDQHVLQYEREDGPYCRGGDDINKDPTVVVV